MKKWISLFLCMVLVLGLSACGDTKADPSGSSVPQGALSEIVDEIYAKKAPALSVETVSVDLSDEYALESFTGLKDASKISEAVASEPMISAQAYSLVLVRLKNAADAKDVASAMRSGINQRKWVCVEADVLQVAAAGNLVLLVMMQSDFEQDLSVQEIVDAFREICGGKLDVELT